MSLTVCRGAAAPAAESEHLVDDVARIASRSLTDSGTPASAMSEDTRARISASTRLRSAVASFSRLSFVSSLRCTLPRTSRYCARRAFMTESPPGAGFVTVEVAMS
jgi:hypothetical protein